MNYKSLLYEINNAPIADTSTVNVPSNKQLYAVDLDSRTISGPETISVQGEHYAETVYFLVDRFYDNMDLAQTNCVVQYATDAGSFVYAVPFCDISTYDGKIIIPWSISLSATQVAGTIRYFIRFYLIDDASVLDASTGAYNPEGAEFAYSLSTRPASSKVMPSLSQEDFVAEDENLQLPERYFEFINVMTRMVDNATTYWVDADEEMSGNHQAPSGDALLEAIEKMPYIGENGNWWINGVDSGISAYPESDYNNLLNRPTINDGVIEGDMTGVWSMTDSDLRNILNNSYN